MISMAADFSYRFSWLLVAVLIGPGSAFFFIRGSKAGSRGTCQFVSVGTTAATFNIPTWGEMAEQLETSSFSKENSDESVLTIYRDTNGWCPFCERVWLALRYKNIPYHESLISLQNKPDWYKELVPSALVPAIVLYGTDESNQRILLWESMDILKALDENFPHTPKLVHDGPEFEEAIQNIDEVASAGFRFTYGGLPGNATATPKTPEDYRTDFSNALDKLDSALQASLGPFRLGSEFSAVDVVMIPNMERWRYQLPLTKQFDILDNRPHIQQWFQAMESLDAYKNRVMGDAYSWTAVTSTFLRYFAKEDDPETQEAIALADYCAMQLSEEFDQYHGSDHTFFAKEAAAKLVSNYEAVVADCTRQEPISQKQLTRAADPEIASQVLRYVTSLLLHEGSDASVIERARTTALVDLEDTKEGIRVARTVALRLCVPRDMGAPAAAVLRAILSITANRLEINQE